MIRTFFIFSLVVLLISKASADPQTLRLATTTSFNNSGLSDVLLPAIKLDIGIDVQLLVVGTGQALRLGQAGDVDAILVHSKEAEDVFIADGFGTHRREIMYNDFVLVGPSSDPANIKGALRASEALVRIALSQSAFISRGDDSGTHKKELALWAVAGLRPNNFGNWYKAVGASMGSSLNSASGLDAYIMADRASWLKFKNKGSLALLFSGDAVLFNQYSYIPVNPEKHPHINADAADLLEKWLLSNRAKTFINSYKINDQALFIFNGSL